MKLYFYLQSLLIFAFQIACATSLADILEPIVVEESVDFNRVYLFNRKLTDISNIDNFPVIYKNNTVLLKEVPNLAVNLSINTLKELPDSIGNLIQMKEFFLESNKLTELPNSFGNLIQLEELVLEDNKLTELPDSIGNLTQLKEFFLENNQLKEVPSALGNLIQLEALVLANNKLTELPDSIGNLTQLKEFFLENNQLKEVPSALGNLTQLEELDLSNNQLIDLPDSFGNLTQLKKLDLHSNKLTSLQQSLGNLGNLQELDLAINELTELPNSIGNLINLKTLDLRSKQLKDLSESLTLLPYLRSLEVDVSLNASAENVLRTIKDKKGAKLSEWQYILPVNWRLGYQMLELNDKQLSDITGISKLQVRIWDSENKSWTIVPISTIPNLGIQLRNTSVQHIPVEEFRSLTNLMYLSTVNTPIARSELVELLTSPDLALQKINLGQSYMKDPLIEPLLQQLQNKHRTLYSYTLK